MMHGTNLSSTEGQINPRIQSWGWEFWAIVLETDLKDTWMRKKKKVAIPEEDRRLDDYSFIDILG